jgi:Leucine-rich repeat (LRR) protein
LRILLAVNAFVAGLFLLSQLDPSTVKKLGPAGEYVFDLLHPSIESEVISSTGQHLKAEVRALGGNADFMGQSYRFLGFLGRTEQFHIRINQTEFGDDELAVLVKKYGDRIWGLDLRHTRTTDKGLRHLEGLSQIQNLTLGNDDSRFLGPNTVPISPITDAGLAHLKGLTQLMHLNVSGLPITDSGLDALKDLPQLGSLYLSRTKIKGQGLGRLKSLPRLAIIYLDDGELTDDGLSSLAGASNLQFLSLSRVPLTAKGLQALKGLPRLDQLELTGCGLLDEELCDLKRGKPGLKIMRN